MPDSESLLPFLLTAVSAYLIGSVSFSIVFTKIFAHTDVRKHGSGNAGTTNVLRTAGKLPAILTFVGDFLKCVFAIVFGLFIFRVFGRLYASGGFLHIIFTSSDVTVTFIKFVAGLFCMVGHIYPVYFGFKGGKGVVSTLALMLLISWQVGLIGLGIFIVLTVITKIVSASVLAAAVSLPISTFVITQMTKGGYVVANTLLAGAMTVILFITHRQNIVRLLNGTESRIGKRNKEAS